MAFTGFWWVVLVVLMGWADDCFQEIQKLRANAKAFEGFWDLYRECTAKVDVDKTTPAWRRSEVQQLQVNILRQPYRRLSGNSACSNFWKVR